MTDSAQKQKATTLLSLHGGGRMLILPNVWDPIGARILQAKGYRAVATASAAISTSLGYRDGERIKRSTLIDVIGRIARSVVVPVTADIEAGYAKSISELEETIRAVIASGVVGVNIEDGLKGGNMRPVEEQCARIATVRACAAREGLHLVINARIDSYESGAFADPADATEDAVARATAYAIAGADCVYPIGPGDEATVRLLRERIAAPINILGSPTAAPLPVLQSIGINRVSFGPFVLRALLRRFEEIADALIKHNDTSGMRDMLSRAEAGGYLADGPE
ncbi:MAG: isocitrate lyase/phosphoenolpyruvate mutase family protein [Candidatus Krumholzibacteria bacterium]|nr:isocitrate lyase/phosphoenolpyruvate mutase family protein [Candidatus Krumholzibacteria bacterium]MDH4338351.1 isocitrate lyase/phosphoenolpyruvate mutase family protein [Candidatus Krumholzibacteria bacterium]MDH5269801.1 isocitrate lyase/phosphoenolpyruvate mutase family protein [Candidatus Krumholzibacteria bacterium]